MVRSRFRACQKKNKCFRLLFVESIPRALADLPWLARTLLLQKACLLSLGCA